MRKQKTTENDLLLKWQAPIRPFKKRDRVYFQTIAALVFLLVAILLFIKEWLLIGVILALFFVSYVLASMEPERIAYKITKKGLWFGENFYRFSELSEYWFEEHLGQKVLVLLSPLKRPWELNLVLDNVSEKEVDEILRDRLVFREKPLKSFVDNFADWLRKKFALSS